MSRGPYPILLMLAMSLPSAVRALGLGDIRVDSALNEPLSAQIDIVGATRDELAALTATVANREIFQRYGADRPSFLSTATFKVGIDAQGRAVLNVRSADAFTDPLVSFLVDLRWGKNEIVREYSLLLDPPNYQFPRSAAEAALAAAPAAVAPTATAPVAPAQPATANAAMAPAAVTRGVARHARDAGTEPTSGAEPTDAGRARVKVQSGDTLRGIARRAGATTETQAQTLMIAIFRANPAAFDGNINRLHRGAILTIPMAADLAAVSSADAKREVRAQMTAWRLDGRPAASRHVAAAMNPPAGGAVASAAAAPVAPLRPVANAPVAKEEDAPDASLKNRVQSLEQQLDEMHKQLASEHDKIQSLKSMEAQQAAAPAPVASQAAPMAQAPAVSPAPASADAAKAPDGSVELVSAPILASAPQSKATPATAPVPAPTSSSHAEIFGPVAVTLGLMIAGFAYVRRRVSQTRSPADAGPAPMLAPMPAAMTMPPFETHPFDAPPAAAYSEPMSAQDAFKAAPQPAPESPRHAEPVFADTIEEPMPPASPESTSNLEIDIEALERSYLESLPADTAAHRHAEALEMSLDDPALADTTTVETVSVEPNESDTHLIEAELNTVMMDVEALDRSNHADAHPEELGQRDGLALARVPDAAVHSTALDFNLVDLDATAQHVQMATGLHEQPEAADRRMNIVDVLKAAIEKDPKRRDLRMKLLETYYSLASINQRAFMDVVRKLSRERDLLTPDDWKKVTLMGREIAADDILFADLDPPKEGKDLANCA